MDGLELWCPKRNVIRNKVPWVMFRQASYDLRDSLACHVFLSLTIDLPLLAEI